MCILIIVFNIFLISVVSSDDSDLRVVNGKETYERFLVQIVVKFLDEHTTCSGSILNKHWVITAAHCFDDGPVLYVNIDRFNAGAPVVTVDRLVIHPNYHHKKHTNLLDYVKHDLALLRTKEPMNLDGYLKPIDLSAISPNEGDRATVAGYGLPELEAREGGMVISYCSGYLMCANSVEEEPRPALGDSGGPVIVNGRLVGVVSSSVYVIITENRVRRRIFYTEYFADIASNYDWIESVIRQ